MRVLEVAFTEVSSGRAEMPTRLMMPVKGKRGVLALMPAFLPSLGALATKIVTVFADNPGRSFPMVMGLVLLNDVETGAPDYPWLACMREAV